MVVVVVVAVAEVVPVMVVWVVMVVAGVEVVVLVVCLVWCVVGDQSMLEGPPPAPCRRARRTIYIDGLPLYISSCCGCLQNKCFLLANESMPCRS